MALPATGRGTAGRTRIRWQEGSMGPIRGRKQGAVTGRSASSVPEHKIRRPAEDRQFGGYGRLQRPELLRLLAEYNVRFLRLQFIDVMGVLKSVEVPRSQFEKALDGDIMFDGSSIEGFVRVEESDMA